MKAEFLKTEVDKWLKNYFENRHGYNALLYEAMGYSLNIGGKRIRPILVLLTYSLYRDDYDKIIDVASALEMIHTYSLIHDDLPCMDNDDLRRGKPTNHKVYGEAMAVLAGDGLLNEAMNVMFRYCSKNNNICSIKACRVIAEAAGSEGMIAGQAVDLLSENKAISDDELHYMHRKKTGELIKAAVVSGAVLADAPYEDIETLESYGEKLGLAFQIKDDILDVIGDINLLGKKIKSDEKDHKTTFVSVYGLEKCKGMCKNLTDDCIRLLDNLDRDTTEIKEITTFLLKREF